MNVILSSVAELHQMLNFYLVHYGGNLVIALDVPLTSYSQAFKVFELRSHPIRIPNSDLDSILQVESKYVAIHEATSHMVVLTPEQAAEVARTRHHLLRYPVIQVKTAQTCIFAIYLNNARDAKQYCKHLVRPTSLVATIERLDDFFFFLRGIPRYTIDCQLTLHHNQSLIRRRSIQYQCLTECSVNLQMFNTSRIVETMDASEVFETLTCKLQTAIVEVPFVLPLSSNSNADGLVSRFHTNLNVLQSFFDNDMLSGLSGDSSFQLLAEIDVPQARVEFLDEDPLIKVQLDELLNKTESNQKIYASYWRGPWAELSDNQWVLVGLHFTGNECCHYHCDWSDASISTC